MAVKYWASKVMLGATTWTHDGPPGGDESQWFELFPAPEGIREAGSNYVADHESQPKQFKFSNGRRVWITSEGFLDTDFSPLIERESPPTGEKEATP